MSERQIVCGAPLGFSGYLGVYCDKQKGHDNGIHEPVAEPAPQTSAEPACVTKLLSPYFIPTRININCPIHGTHSPANTNRCICLPGLPLDVLEFHVRINKREVKSLISDGLAEQCKPGEDYATVVENLFANEGIKSALVVRIHGNKEG